MVEQTALFRASDPPTSVQAAESIPAGVIECAVMSVFLTRYRTTLDGLTDDQLCASLSEMHAPSVKTARSRLSKAGRLVNSGRVLPSNRGRPSIVWRLP